MHIVLLDAGTFLPKTLDLGLLQALPATITWYTATAPHEVKARIETADIVITNKVIINADHFQHTPRLKCIIAAATGFNHIDIAAAKRARCVVCHTPGYATTAVAERTIGLMLALATQLMPSIQLAHRRWPTSPAFCVLHPQSYELKGKTLAVIGWGAIGQAVGRLATALGMQVLATNRPNMPNQSERIPWQDALAVADVISLHCPLTHETRHLINATTLQQMKQGALLINTARGELVEEHALLTALQAGHLGGAGLDVLSQEPPASNNPLLHADLPNLLITPHNAWGTQEARQQLANTLAHTIKAFSQGQPIHQVT